MEKSGISRKDLAQSIESLEKVFLKQKNLVGCRKKNIKMPQEKYFLL